MAILTYLSGDTTAGIAAAIGASIILGYAFSELAMPVKSFILQDPSDSCRSQTGV